MGTASPHSSCCQVVRAALAAKMLPPCPDVHLILGQIVSHYRIVDKLGVAEWAWFIAPRAPLLVARRRSNFCPTTSLTTPSPWNALDVQLP